MYMKVMYVVCVLGIEESFKKKCKLMVEHVDCLKMKIEELKKSQAEGWYRKYEQELCIICLVLVVTGILVCHVYYSGDHIHEHECDSEQVECRCRHVVGDPEDLVSKVCLSLNQEDKLCIHDICT